MKIYRKLRAFFKALHCKCLYPECSFKALYRGFRSSHSDKD